MPLSADQHAFYETHGYLVVEQVIPPAVLAELKDRIHALATSPVEQAVGVKRESESVDAGAPLRKLNTLVPLDPFFKQVASLPSITGPAMELTRSSRGLLLYNDQVFLKPAHCGSEKPLHQDNSYFKVQPMDQGVTCWLALDDATVDNGCMRYIDGSHRLGLIPHRLIRDTPHLTPEDPRYIGQDKPVPIPAGACIFHHLLVLHGSHANTSDKSRRSWALHYVNPQAQCPHPPKNGMTRVSPDATMQGS